MCLIVSDCLVLANRDLDRRMAAVTPDSQRVASALWQRCGLMFQSRVASALLLAVNT